MQITKNEFYRRAANGEGQIFSRSWTINNPKAIVQLVHDTCEHSKRYDEFARALNQSGYNVYANDLVGHGMSKQGHKGAAALKKGGLKFVLEDIMTLFFYAENKEGQLPKILIGQGAGALFAQLYASEYKDVNALILLGTMKARISTDGLISLANINILMHGNNFASPSIKDIMMPSVKMVGVTPEDKVSWLSKDENEIIDYANDEDCGFPLTALTYKELLMGLKTVTNKKWAKEVPDIPILIMSGTDDEIGEYTKAPKLFSNRLWNSDHTEVVMKLFRDDRHDLLHETDRDDVIAFIILWLQQYLKYQK